MFTEETLRGGIAKQAFGSWDQSTKASCVTRGNNSIFYSSSYVFPTCLQWCKEKYINGQEVLMYNSEGIMETLKGKICRMEVEQEMKGEEKSTF